MTVVIGSVSIDVYRLLDKMKNEKKLDANIREKGTVDGQEKGRLVWISSELDCIGIAQDSL